MKKGTDWIKDNRINLIYGMMMILIGICFFFCLGENGYVLEKDSNVHIEGSQWNMSYGYILYPMLAKVCKNLFSKYYLEAIFIFQSILAMTTSVLVAEYVRYTYRFSRKIGILVFVLSFGPYAYSLPQYVASHGILTEGLTFPLFNVWMVCALQIYRSNKKNWIFLLICLSAVMTVTRPQLLLLFVIDFLLLLDKYFIQRAVVKIRNAITKFLFFIGILSFALFVGACIFVSNVKNAWYPQLTDAVAGRVLCVIDEEDEDLYSGEIKQLIKIIYREVDENKNREEYFRTDIKRWEDVCNATNNNTKMLGRLIVDNLDVFSCPSEEISSKKIKGEIAYPLMISHWFEYLEMTMELILQSLVVSVFIHPDWAYTLGYCGAVALYILAISLLFVHKKYHCDVDYRFPMRTVLLVIVSLCGFTNIIFMGIQRYVVYPFGWFYIALVILYSGLVKNK